MKELRFTAVLAAVMGSLLAEAFATDRFFDDIAAESPSKRYKVEAKSPDNTTSKGRKAFQAPFTEQIVGLAAGIFQSCQGGAGEKFLPANVP